MGLDFWPMGEGRKGRWDDSCTAGDGWLFRGLVKRFTAPGPDGTVRTVQGQMMLEGVQETEAIVALIRGKQKAAPEMAARIDKCLEKRRMAKTVGLSLAPAMVSQDLNDLAAGQYALAAELAGETGEGEWNHPPAAPTQGGGK